MSKPDKEKYGGLTAVRIPENSMVWAKHPRTGKVEKMVLYSIPKVRKKDRPVQGGEGGYARLCEGDGHSVWIKFTDITFPEVDEQGYFHVGRFGNDYDAVRSV